MEDTETNALSVTENLPHVEIAKVLEQFARMARALGFLEGRVTQNQPLNLR